MRFLFILCLSLACFARPLTAATLNWSAAIDHGFSQTDGTELPTGSLVRLGWFRHSVSGEPMTDADIQALAGVVSLLEASFVEVASTTLGSGLGGSVAGHFAASSTVDTSATGLNVEGRQMYLWVLNAASIGTATQQAILYWSLSDTTTNPDGSADVPGTRWVFPMQGPPGATTIDLTDLTTGTGALAAGARVVAGSYPGGTSSTTGAANFSLAEIVVTPVISTLSQIAGGVVGSPYSLTFQANGGAQPYEWDVSPGTLPDGLSLNSSGTLAGIPTIAGSYSFTVRVTDDPGSVGTVAVTMIVAENALAIQTAQSLSGQEGAALDFDLEASGGTAPYTWALTEGTLPRGLALEDGTLSGVPLESGSFTFTIQVTDAGLLVDERDFTLSLTASSLAITSSFFTAPVVGYSYSSTLAATGGSAPYSWAVSGGSLPPGLSLNSTTGAVSGKPTSVANGQSCFFTVTDAAGVTRTKEFFFTVLGTLPLPTMVTPVFADTMVASSFTQTLAASYYPKRFTVSGLPSGLSYVPATGVISGKPKVAGTFVIRINATNAKGTSPTVSATLRVRPVPGGALGSFIAEVGRHASVNGNLGGRLDLTTTTAGSYTARLLMGGITRTTTGLLTTNVASGAVSLTATFTRGKEASLVLTILFTPATNNMVGDLRVSTDSPTQFASVIGWRQTWNTTTNPATLHLGYYTASLEGGVHYQGNAGIPQGAGYVGFSIGEAGTLTVTGRTADGNVLTTSGFLSQQGQILLYQSLYKHQGSLSGQMMLSTASSGMTSDSQIVGSVFWSKPADTARAYGDGFGPLLFHVDGGYLAPASRGHVVLGLPEETFEAMFSEGGLDLAAMDPTTDEAEFTDALKVVMPPAGDSDNPGGITMNIHSATGAINGSFTLVDGALKRKTTFQGMIVRGQSGAWLARGYFLLPQIPGTGETIHTSSILSGLLSLND